MRTAHDNDSMSTWDGVWNAVIAYDMGLMVGAVLASERIESTVVWVLVVAVAVWCPIAWGARGVWCLAASLLGEAHFPWMGKVIAMVAGFAMGVAIAWGSLTGLAWIASMITGWG